MSYAELDRQTKNMNDLFGATVARLKNASAPKIPTLLPWPEQARDNGVHMGGDVPPGAPVRIKGGK